MGDKDYCVKFEVVDTDKHWENKFLHQFWDEVVRVSVFNVGAVNPSKSKIHSIFRHYSSKNVNNNYNLLINQQNKNNRPVEVCTLKFQ